MFQHSPIRVLLVEDNVPSLNVLKIMISQFTSKVTTAVDAELAFELVKSHPFDLMITDIGLPGYSGDRLTSMVREYEKEHHLKPMKIVGLTGYSISDIRELCLNAGMDDVYSKPISVQELESLVMQSAYALST